MTDPTQPPIVIEAMTENTDGTPLHFAVCAGCGARWAGPFRAIEHASEVAASMNADPWFEVPRAIRAELCCVPASERADRGERAVYTEPINTGSVPHVVRVPMTGVLSALFSGCVFVGWLAWQIARALFGLARGAVRLGWLVVPVGAVLALAVWAVGAALPPVQVTYLDLFGSGLALGALAVLAVVAWRTVMPRVVAPIEREENHGHVYSTPLRTPRGASSVSPVSKTPADERPKG